jgi:hydroxymethylglutaryl-CoA lyase
MTTRIAQIVEVSPRDGLQSIGSFIPTEQKIALIKALHACGLQRIETTSFVSASAVPQMADAAEVLAAVRTLPGLDPSVLVPSRRQVERALSAGANHLAFVVSVSAKHNMSNVKRTPAQSVAEYAQLVQTLPPGIRLRVNLATAFDCPYQGTIDPADVLALLSQLIPIAPWAEVALCDTTGRAAPTQVAKLFESAIKRFPDVNSWAFHAHDTYGLGVANVFAAWQSGVAVIDASAAGLGGCPFAPGATGNVATEDVVWMFERMGIATGVDLARLCAVGRLIDELPGAQRGGRVRGALEAQARLSRARSAIAPQTG